MKFENLKDNLKKEILPVYLINGGESFLTVSALSLIEKALSLTLPDFNKTVFSFDTTKTAKDIVEACQVLPMIDSKRLVVVHDYLNKKNEGEKKVFEKYFKDPCKSTCLIFFSTQKSEFFSSLEGQPEIIECDKVSLILLKKWILQKAKEKDFEITSDGVEKLMDYCNYSITKIDMELNKLFSAFYDSKNLSQKEIEENVTKDVEYVVFDLTNAICKKDSQSAFLLVDAMLKNKETNIISTITNHFRRLFFVSRSDFSKKEMSEFLNVKEYAVFKYKTQAQNFSQVRLKEIYDKCLEIDFMIKSGLMETKNATNFLLAWILK